MSDVIAIKKILILAGGTGGHVVPALSVAEYFQSHKVAVHWIGTTLGMESYMVKAANIPISFISIYGLRGHSWWRWLKAPMQIVKAIIQSYQIIRREKPDIVLSMGGYIAGPGAIAAWLQRVPVLLHEQNAVEGWTNRLLARFAKRIMVAFPGAFENQKKKVVHTGNPIRQSIVDLPPPEIRWRDRATTPLNILILGGSLGAAILNETLPKTLALFPPIERPQIWHQTGKHHLEKTKLLYRANGVEARVVDFIADMSEAYEWADIVICRSGALTVSEIAAVGVSSIFIPFPYAIGDHQTYNARYLSDVQGAILLPQSQLSEKYLYEIVKELFQHPQKRLAMAKVCRQFAKPQATLKVAEQCIEVGRGI